MASAALVAARASVDLAIALVVTEHDIRTNNALLAPTRPLREGEKALRDQIGGVLRTLQRVDTRLNQAT